MPYVGVSHGSDINYIFNGHFLEGVVSDENERLSNRFTESFINFAHTGNPNTENLEYWPTAKRFEQMSPERSTSHDLNIQVIGGPSGAGHATLDCSPKNSNNLEPFPAKDSRDQIRLQGYQMSSTSSPVANSHIQLSTIEKLKYRCAVIDGLAGKLGV